MASYRLVMDDRNDAIKFALGPVFAAVSDLQSQDLDLDEAIRALRRLHTAVERAEDDLIARRGLEARRTPEP